MVRRYLVLCGLVAAGSALSQRASATSETLFGFGARDTSLAQSDVADASASDAPYVNPAAASEPGTRISVGRSHGFSRLTIDGEDAGLRDIAGTDVSLQVGTRLGEATTLGGGLALHLPDRSLARIAFAPGTEPSFVRFEPAAQRTTADFAVALRYAWLSLGLGASVLVSAEGRIDFLLGQDGNGTYADGDTDLSLPYAVAPTAGIAADFGFVGVGFRYRGAQSLELDLATRADVAVQGNPLNGSTVVSVSGYNGYVPATLDMGVAWGPWPELLLLGSVQLARWSRAPSPIANLSMDVDLGLTPGQREGRFVRPAYRDTLSPRVGIEVNPGGLGSILHLRGGYAYTPSPVPEQSGLASPADAATHAIAAGAGCNAGVLWGVEVSIDAAAQLLLLQNRHFDKGSDTLPFSQYEAGGKVWFGSVGLEATWR